MSEKRFEWDIVGIFDNKTNHFYYKTFDNEEVADLLNKLSEENEQLRRELERVCLQNSLVSDELDILKRLTLVEKGGRFLDE